MKGRRRKNSKAVEYTKKSSIETLLEKETSNIASGSEKLNLDGNIEESGKSLALDNAPSYYVVAYIMRTDEVNSDANSLGLYDVPDFTALDHIENNDTSNGSISAIKKAKKLNKAVTIIT